MCSQLSADPSTNLHRAQVGLDRAEWPLPTQLLAAAVNALRVANWQRSKDGARNKNRPEQTLPPWEQDENRQVTKLGGSSMTLTETDEWLGWRRVN